MLSGFKRSMPGGTFLLSAATGWLFSACTLLALFAFAANRIGIGERGLAYGSSLISFLSAVAAGLTATAKDRSVRLIGAFVAASALVILLLTLGFLIEGKEMNPSAIISVVSFTYAGMLLGVFLLPERRSNTGKRRSKR